MRPNPAHLTSPYLRSGPAAARSAALLLAACAAALGLGGCAYAARVASPPAQASGAPARVERGRERTPRFSPSTRSTAEIRAEAARRPYPLDFGERLDRGHDWLYVNAQHFVEDTDRRFAPPDAELLAVPATPFRLGVLTEAIDRRDGVALDLDLNLDVTLNLPNIERRLRIFITSDDVAESPDVVGERRNVRAGLRFAWARDLDFDLGVRGDLPPIAFASLRWGKFYPAGDWDFYPFAKLFAETNDGLGVSGGFTFDRRVGDATILRSSSFAKWRLDRAATEWTQAFLVARADELLVPDRYGHLLQNRDLARGYGMQLLATGARTSRADGYEATVFYKRPLRHRWLYGRIEALVRWDREYAWRADPGIRIGFDALFWDLSRSRPDPGAAPILPRPQAP